MKRFDYYISLKKNLLEIKKYLKNSYLQKEIA